jgi:hypothetical protein
VLLHDQQELVWLFQKIVVSMAIRFVCVLIIHVVGIKEVLSFVPPFGNLGINMSYLIRIGRSSVDGFMSEFQNQAFDLSVASQKCRQEQKPRVYRK